MCCADVRDADELARSEATGALKVCARRLLQAFLMASGAAFSTVRLWFSEGLLLSVTGRISRVGSGAVAPVPW